MRMIVVLKVLGTIAILMGTGSYMNGNVHDGIFFLLFAILFFVLAEQRSLKP